MYANHSPAVPHDAPMRYNPARHNPLSLPAKIGIGTAVVLAVSAGAWLLWPKEAKAGVPGRGPTPGPTPPPSSGKPKRPSGHPPPFGGSCLPPDSTYDTDYWEAGGEAAAQARIFEAFEELGYQTPGGRSTMNRPGPDGKLGGGDDVSNTEVKRFQEDYNAVSRAGNFVGGMRGLAPDGYVGPCTLNGLKLVLDELDEEESWPELVAQARS